jgi:spore coat protein U-like protein
MPQGVLPSKCRAVPSPLAGFRLYAPHVLPRNRWQRWATIVWFREEGNVPFLQRVSIGQWYRRTDLKSITRLTKQSVTRVIGLGLGLLALGMIAAGPALAATITTNMAVSSSVTATCVIAAAPLSFAAYNTVTTANVDAEAILTVTCTNGTPGIQITLGQGLTPATGSTTAIPLRQMTNGGAGRLAYFLYQETGRTTVWGDTLATAPAAVVGTGAAQTATVFGRIPSGQTTVVAGTYTDTVVATVNF